MNGRTTIDVAHLPDHAFGSRSLLWWATLAIIAIEGTVFILATAGYFYLQGNELDWPPPDTRLPDHFWGTLNIFVLLVSCVPNHFVKKAAEEMDIRKVRLWIVIADLFAIGFVVIRALEYGALNVSWDSNAYGSATWTLLSLHSIHLLTDLIDTLVLTAMMFTRHGHESKRFVDVSENAFYWYFVVLAWPPIYGVIYWAPRLL